MSFLDHVMREARSAYLRNLEITLPATIIATKYPKEVTRFLARAAGSQLRTTWRYKKETLQNLTRSAKQVKNPIKLERANRFMMRRVFPIAAAYTLYQGVKNMEDYHLVTDYGLI